jgi:hypothetical protein
MVAAQREGPSVPRCQQADDELIPRGHSRGHDAGNAAVDGSGSRGPSRGHDDGNTAGMADDGSGSRGIPRGHDGPLVGGFAPRGSSLQIPSRIGNMTGVEIKETLTPIILPSYSPWKFTWKVNKHAKKTNVNTSHQANANTSRQAVQRPKKLPSTPWSKFRKGLELIDAMPNSSSSTPPVTPLQDYSKLDNRKSSPTAKISHIEQLASLPTTTSSPIISETIAFDFKSFTIKPRTGWIWPSTEKDWNALDKNLNEHMTPLMKTQSLPTGAKDVALYFQGALFSCLDSLLPQEPNHRSDRTNRGRDDPNTAKSKEAVDGYKKRKSSLPTSLDDLKEKKRIARARLRTVLKTSSQAIEKIKECKKLHNELVRLHHAVLRAQKRDQKSLDNQKELSRFMKNKWKFATEIFRGEPTPSGTPECSAEDVRKHLENSWRDPNPGVVYERPVWMKDLPEPRIAFNLMPITEAELVHCIKVKNSSSAPTPFDPVPYRVYKRCPSLTEFLLMVFNRLHEAMMKREYPADLWCDLWLTLIYKGNEKPRNLPKSFRQILQKSPLEKLWNSIWATRITSFLMKNDFLDAAQHAGKPGVSGCLEIHTIVNRLIHQARTNGRNLIIHAADFQDAYGSVRHSLISFSTKHHRLPPEITHLIDQMLKNLRVTGQLNGEKILAEFNNGGVTGDPLTVILFIMVMNIGLRRLQLESPKGSKLLSEDAGKVAFMDDLTQMTPREEYARRQSVMLSEFVEWTQCMSLHPDKLEVFALKDGKQYDPKLAANVNDKVLSYKPCDMYIKLVGRKWPYEKADAECQESIRADWQRILDEIQRKPFPGNKKIELADIVLKGFTQWMLTIYDLPLSFGKVLLTLWTGFLKIWSGLNRCAAIAIFFLPKSEGGLGLVNPLLLLRQCQVSRRMILLQSRNKLVIKIAKQELLKERKSAGLPSQRRIFRPWIIASDLMEKVKKEAEMSERHLSPRQVREQVAGLLKQEALTELKEHLKTLVVQGKVLNEGNDILWMKDATCMERKLLKFGLNAIMDTLPTGANRTRWFKSDGNCGRCGVRQTAHHVFSNCEVLLNKGYYTARHDAILRELYLFAKVHLDVDWIIWVDLKDCGSDSYHHLPSDWTESEQRPDIVLWNPTLNESYLVELTVPADIGMAAAKLRKVIRYTELAKDISGSERSRSCKIITIEIGALGSHTKQPLKDFFDVLNKPPTAACNELLMRLSKLALNESWKIWLARDG